MEGVASEAASLAGHLRLGELKVLYDDNRISIDGPTSLAFSEDVAARFAAYGWRILRVADGNDLDEIGAALDAAAAEAERPTLVVVRTHIGFGSPKQDSAEAHGAPLGAEAARATKRALGWPEEPAFLRAGPGPRALHRRRRAWRRGSRRLARAAGALPRRPPRGRRRARAPARRRCCRRAGTPTCPRYVAGAPGLATRAASGKAIQGLAARLPELVGGSADLAESNNTPISGAAAFSAAHPEGRNFHFGVREHAMGAILNGLALSGLLRPYGGTFLIFSDYMRPAIRLAALMRLPVVYVFTHDSIFLGEDGPTHQPVEQLAALRAIPGLVVLRPADARRDGGGLAGVDRAPGGPDRSRPHPPEAAHCSTGARRRAEGGVDRGAYVVHETPAGRASGGAAARERLGGPAGGRGRRAPRRARRRGARRLVPVVGAVRRGRRAPTGDAVLPPEVTARLAVEAGSALGWHRWVGDRGEVIGIEGFGASAPAEALAGHFGFTAEAVTERAAALAGAGLRAPVTPFGELW